MSESWFRPRGYKHFDVPVGYAFAEKSSNPLFVENHTWLPLIHYVKRTKRYKPKDGRTVNKDRPIMYASHRDACILSRYAHEIDRALELYYELNKLSENVIAYRKLGRSNYDFSADAYRFCLARSPCAVLCFDITGFFDHLKHPLLKNKLKQVLGVNELSGDWYQVFKHVTCYKRIDRADLTSHPVFGPRFESGKREPVGTIAEVKAAGICITRNKEKFGIPQGTPISSSLSNVYMIDVDKLLASLCTELGALYQRYSDDILIVCAIEDQIRLETELKNTLEGHGLSIQEEKTDRVRFDARYPKAFQYLGFNISPDGAVIHPGSMSRQWRRAKRSIAKVKAIGQNAIATGNASKIYTKRLRRKLSPIGARNFSSYARRSAKVFGSKKIIYQVRRLERMADQAIRELKSKPVNTSS